MVKCWNEEVQAIPWGKKREFKVWEKTKYNSLEGGKKTVTETKTKTWKICITGCKHKVVNRTHNIWQRLKRSKSEIREACCIKKGVKILTEPRKNYFERLIHEKNCSHVFRKVLENQTLVKSIVEKEVKDALDKMKKQKAGGLNRI